MMFPTCGKSRSNFSTFYIGFSKILVTIPTPSAAAARPERKGMIIMTGGTRKRGTTWFYYFDLGTVGGKRQKKEKGGFKTKKEAEAALAKVINEYNNTGQLFEPSGITVSDYLDQWYDLYCKPNLKYNIQIGYLRIMEGHLKPRERIILTLEE